MAHHAFIVPIEEHRGTVLLGVVKGYPLRKMRLRCGYRAYEKQRIPQGTVRRQKHGRVLDLLRERQELLSQCVCRLVLSAYEIIIPQSTQYWEKLVRIFQVLAEVSSTSIGLSDFRSRVAFGGNE